MTTNDEGDRHLIMRNRVKVENLDTVSVNSSAPPRLRVSAFKINSHKAPKGQGAKKKTMPQITQIIF